MPGPLVALVAAAVYQVRTPLADSDALNRTLQLIADIAGRNAVSFDVGETDFRVDGVPMALAAPGASIIQRALLDHGAMRLVVPGGTSVSQWHDLIDLLASAPGVYSSLDDLRDALRATVPDAVVSGIAGAAAEGDLREALFELPGLRAGSPNPEPVRAADPRHAEVVTLTARLDPLLQAATGARDTQDYPLLANLLLQIHELEDGSNDDLRAIVARERRRVIPPPVLEGLARAIPKPGSSPAISQALGSLGREGAAALFNALTGAPGPHERRAYIDALVATRGCDDAILEGLGSTSLPLARDLAEVAGRKQMERAVPALTHMLKHSSAEVRTAAWHALETIATPAAIKALRN